MARIKIEDLPVAENLTPEQEELIQGAGLRSFRPALEGLEDRQMMASNLTAALPVTPPAPEPAAVSLRQFLNVPQMNVLPASAAPQGQATAPGAAGALPGASAADPLVNAHRNYIGLKDLRPGDIILNTTSGFVSDAIKVFSNSNYNHAAIYVGNGQVVEAVAKGVKQTNLKDFLNDDHIERVMVLRRGDLNDTRRQAIADFAISKVGKPYNYGGVLENGLTIKHLNADYPHRNNYYCSQLVAAAYSSAGARLDRETLDLSPGELAGKVNGKLTALGALYDKGYHRSVREGRECVNLDVTDRERQFVESSFKQLGGGFSYRLNRLTVDSTGNVLGHLTVKASGGDIDVYFGSSGFTTRFVGQNGAYFGSFADVLKERLGSLYKEMSHKYFGAPANPAAAPQAAGRHTAVDAVFAAAGAGQAGQAVGTITHTMTGSGTL
jgi:cell wall-associated NlpC family hydrolase